jgi:hypothetical protein
VTPYSVTLNYPPYLELLQAYRYVNVIVSIHSTDTFLATATFLTVFSGIPDVSFGEVSIFALKIGREMLNE